jgi:acyl transferase domain-containing protein
VGIHLAFCAIQARQCAAGAAGGVNLILHHETSAIAQKAGMLAPDGRCKALSAAADGYGRAEACGMLLLLPSGGGRGGGAAAAQLAGSAVNQDGRSSSLTAPNGPSQQEVMRQALAAAGLTGQEVTALGMHGTGTALGDPIEVGAAAPTLSPASGGDVAARRAPLVLMASKSWIGHSEPGAGLVGLTHAQLALTKAAARPILHLGPLNQYVSAVMERQPGGWSAPRQPGALGTASHAAAGGMSAMGVSAFAFQGTNAHALLAAQPFSVHRTAPLAAGTAWQQQRYWVSPPAHR